MGFVILTIKQKNELGFITQTINFGKLLDLGLIVNPTLAQAMNLMKSPPQTKRQWAPTMNSAHWRANLVHRRWFF